MSDLMKFEFEGSGVRVVERDGEPWFVAKDVCSVLGISKYRDAVARLDPDEGCPVVVDTLGGPQEMVALSESGLYGLIMVSRKPEAQAFKRWIRKEVIPQIRKTGSYSLQKQIPKTLHEALQLAADIERERFQLAERVEEMSPKADGYDVLMGSGVNISVGDFAKALGIPGLGQNKLFQYFYDHGYLFKNSQDRPRAYQQYVDSGLFAHQEQVFELGDTGSQGVNVKVLLTPKGQDYFVKKLVPPTPRWTGYLPGLVPIKGGM